METGEVLTPAADDGDTALALAVASGEGLLTVEPEEVVASGSGVAVGEGELAVELVSEDIEGVDILIT